MDPINRALPDVPKRVHSTGGFMTEEVALANRNSGLPLEALRYDVTPAGLHYLLIHFDVPFVADAARWRLDLGGLVERPLTLSLADLQRLPQRTTRVTLECAGNGRALLSPRWQSMPWQHGAVGTAEWTGTSLRHVLERAGIKPDAADIVFFGADRGFEGTSEHLYGRSLAPAQALDEEVMLVWAMNGAPLLPQHGFPLRLVVPGWYGMASVKWLTRIEALDRPFRGYQQVGTYVYRDTPGAEGTPVTTMRVKSLMVPPGFPDFYNRRRVLDEGSTLLSGRAWSGAGRRIVKVEVGIDGAWREAILEPAPGRFAWTGWRLAWSAPPGEHELMCRATDETGDTQPLEPRWDSGGFGNNAVQRVAVWVR